MKTISRKVIFVKRNHVQRSCILCYEIYSTYILYISVEYIKYSKIKNIIISYQNTAFLILFYHVLLNLFNLVLIFIKFESLKKHFFKLLHSLVRLFLQRISEKCNLYEYKTFEWMKAHTLNIYIYSFIFTYFKHNSNSMYTTNSWQWLWILTVMC